MKTKIYTFYTDSHEDLLREYFINSFNNTSMDSRFELDITHVPQRSITGNFDSPGFCDTTKDKIKVILRAIDENKNGYFIYSDCDVQFLKPLQDDIFTYDMTDVDIYAQSDQNTICTGFMLCKSSEKLKSFFELVHDKCSLFANDQYCLNSFKTNINYKLLPVEKYFTVGNYIGLWDGRNISAPGEAIVHHANFTIGTENKKKLLDMILKNKNHII